VQAEADVTAIDVALDVDSTKLATIAPFKGRLGEPRISLVRCVVFTRHLGSVASATSRIISKGCLEKVQIPIFGRTEGRQEEALVTIVAQGTGELFELQRKILRAIEPGTVSNPTPAIKRSAIADQSVIFIPSAKVHAFAPFVAGIVGASIYEAADSHLGRSRSRSGSLARKVLWTRVIV